MSNSGPIMRLFEVRAKDGCAKALLNNFATTSADVVRDESGNAGYFFGQLIQSDDNIVVFASLWRTVDAIKARFGEEWQSSYMPPGYNDLIAECSVRHFDLSAGWHVQGEQYASDC